MASKTKSATTTKVSKAAAAPQVQVANIGDVGTGPVPRGVVATQTNANSDLTILGKKVAVGAKLALVSTHRRQYVVVADGKALCYYTASMALGHTNAMQRFATDSYKPHPVKAAHTDRLANMGVLH